MAASDLLLKDQSSTPVPFAPESTDQGANAAGTPIKRTMFGALDGALVSIGAKADAAWDGTAASATLISVMKAGVARLLGIGGSTVPVSGTIALAGGNATAVKVDGSAVTQPVSIQGSVTIAPQRVESLWTDDTGAYFVRVDLGGTITWADISGNAASAPGTGARPAAGATVLLSRSSFQATASATGYSTGDNLDHFVTTDPASGAVLGNFWINLSTGLKLAVAPASANITPSAPLPNNASTASGVAAVVTALGGTLKTTPQSNAQSIDNNGPLSVSGDTVAVVANGMNTGIIRLPSGFTGSIVAEGTADGMNYDVPLSAQLYASTGNTGGVATITTGGVYEVTITGLAGFWVRATTTITGGPVTALVRAANGNKSIRVGAPSGAPVPTLDQNGAAFGTATAMTAGQTYTAGRSVGINATAAGNITLTTSGGSTITLPIYVGWNTYPFAVTSFSWPATGAGAGAVFNLS